MARYEVLWEERARRVENRDAYCVGLVVNRDGERLGMWVPTVTGISLRIGPSEPDKRFWGALAMVGADRVKDQMLDDAPTEWRLEVWSVLVDADVVRSRLATDANVPAEPSDVPILTFLVD